MGAEGPWVRWRRAGHAVHCRPEMMPLHFALLPPCASMRRCCSPSVPFLLGLAKGRRAALAKRLRDGLVALF